MLTVHTPISSKETHFFCFPGAVYIRSACPVGSGSKMGSHPKSSGPDGPPQCTLLVFQKFRGKKMKNYISIFRYKRLERFIFVWSQWFPPIQLGFSAHHFFFYQKKNQLSLPPQMVAGMIKPQVALNLSYSCSSSARAYPKTAHRRVFVITK